MQITIVAIILTSGIVYIGIKIYRTFTHNNGPCTGCPLSDACSKGKKKDNCKSSEKSNNIKY